MSEHWLAREHEVLWPRVWQFACFERDVAEPGHYAVLNTGPAGCTVMPVSVTASLVSGPTTTLPSSAVPSPTRNVHASSPGTSVIGERSAPRNSVMGGAAGVRHRLS